VLATRLSSLLREAVEVELTDNAWTMVSYRRVQGRLRFRLHHMFASAHEQVMRALAGFTGRKPAGPRPRHRRVRPAEPRADQTGGAAAGGSAVAARPRA